MVGTGSAFDRAVAELSAPGARFEMVEEQVRGVPMRVFARRMRSLAEIARRAAARGEREAVVSPFYRLGYADLFRLANGVSRSLKEIGVGRGDRVAILSANSLEWIVTFWATVNIGAIAVGLNGWWTADEIFHGLQDCGAEILVADAPRVERIGRRLAWAPDLRHVFVPDWDALEDLREIDRLRPYDDLLGTPTTEFPDVRIDEDDPAVILYTSGTTGRAKGAIATHRSWIASIDNTTALVAARRRVGDSLDRTERPSHEVALVTVPFFHVAGGHTHLVMGILAGWTLVLLEGRFDAAEALRLIEAEGVTRWTAVPTMVRRVIEHPDIDRRDTSSLHTVAWGGAPAPPELREEVRRVIPSLREGELGNAYGLTETSSAVTFHGERGSGLKPASVGRAVFCVDIRIADASGRSLPAGERGEVQVRGPMVFAGYWNKPEATESVFDDGWFRTGDVGYLDSDGYLFITDRLKDVIIRGGENVYCVEIEDRLVAHPEILDAAVVGVPHTDLGEEVKAVVQVAAGSTLDEAEVREWTRSTLASFKVPSIVEVRTEPLPRNAAGKLLKTVLRNPAGGTGFAETL